MERRKLFWILAILILVILIILFFVFSFNNGGSERVIDLSNLPNPENISIPGE